MRSRASGCGPARFRHGAGRPSRRAGPPGRGGPCRRWRRRRLAAGALTWCWQPPFPLDLARTLGVHRRGRGDPAYQTDAAGAAWRTSLTPDGPGTLRVYATPAPAGPPAAPGADDLAGGALWSTRWRGGRVPRGCSPASRRCSAPRTTRRVQAGPPAGGRDVPAAPRVADRPVGPGVRGARARRARAEGGGRRGQTCVAAAAAPVRRPAAGARAARDAGVPAAAHLGAHPVLGVAPGRGGAGAGPDDHRRGPGRAPPGGDRHDGPRRRRTGGCSPCPGSGRGPRPRSASAPAATRTPCRSATTTCPRSWAGR